MPLITIVIYLAIVGVILWLVETYIPMAAPFKTVIRIVVVIGLILWLIQLLGITGPNVGSLR